MTAEVITRSLGGCRAGTGWVARCPADDDRTPSRCVGETSDDITFARLAHGKTTSAKTIRVEGDRFVGKDKSPQVKLFEFVEAQVRDLVSLYLAVKAVVARALMSALAAGALCGALGALLARRSASQP
jgi:hypothetical protein